MKKLLSGNEAIALGAYEAGVKFGAGYPGTPSTEILENLVNYEGVYCQWSPNEKVGLETAIGAALAGNRAIATMKHVGMNVAADPMFTVAYTGIKAGLVIVCADDPELHSSQNEQDNRNYGRAAKIPILEPSNSEEARLLTVKAFELSEKFDTPVILRITTRIAHTRTVITPGEKQKSLVTKGFERNIPKYLATPKNARARHIILENRLLELQKFNSASDFNKIIKSEKRDKSSIGIIVSGAVYNYIMEIINDIDILKLGMVYPFPADLVKQFCKDKKEIIIIEELDGFFEEELLKLRLNIKITGKELISNCGELNVDILKEKLLNQKNELLNFDKELPPRPPVLCAGCPHRPVFTILRDKELIVSGDIGCYTLGGLPPLNSMDTCICMGASVSAAIGMVKSMPEYENKLVAVIGDSTFIHSGVTGIIDALYNKANITVLILDNRITAMTGHQHHPGTGYTLAGEETIAVDYAKLAQGIGYPLDSIDTVNPLNLKKFTEILNKHLSLGKPSIIIAQSPCALLDKKKKPIYFAIDKEKCVKCMKCVNTGCPAIQIENNFVIINKEACVACAVCKQVCEYDAISAVKR